MKPGWEIKKLEELAIKLFAGGDKPKVFSEHPTDVLNIPVYANGVSFDGLIGYTDKATVEKESITVSARGTIGFCCVRRTPFVPIVRLITIIPIESIKTEFLYYALSNATIENNGVAIPQLTIPMIKGITIPIPSLAEQERIVEVLDREFEKIDAMKANEEQNLQHAKDLFQAALRQELQPKDGWVKYKLQDVCTEYGDYGMSLPSKPYNGIRYLRITDITEWGELNNDFVSADTNEVEDRYMLRDGDVLFARTGATVGKTLVYNENMGTCSYAGYLIRYRLNQEIILPSIMYYITHSKWYYEWITANQKSATLPNISAKLYNSYEIDIPSTLLEQEQIVARLDILNERCKALEENYKKTIALCDDMKQALLRKAFNGEL